MADIIIVLIVVVLLGLALKGSVKLLKERVPAVEAAVEASP